MNITGLLDNYTVHIPEIQRDYAQGRDSAKEIRENLLNDIFSVLRDSNNEAVLNYIYGVPKEGNGTKQLILIDGQQRITTLFLIKLLLSVREGDDVSFSPKLDYATRESSKDFCRFLSDSGKDCLCNNRPSDSIKNHSEFKKKWCGDPTVKSMLNMLDAISDHCRDEDDYQAMLKNLDNVEFSFISLDGFKHTEELYATMNSSGKQLTKFEMMKGGLIKRQVDGELPALINGTWIPNFWNYAKVCYQKSNCDYSDEDFAADKHDSFLYNYFSFITTMLWWEAGAKAQNMTKGKEMPSVKEMAIEVYQSGPNLDFLKFAMEQIPCNNSNKFSEDLLYFGSEEYEQNHETDKTVLFDGRASSETDLIKKCCNGGHDFSFADKCYLWAYFKFLWKKETSGSSGLQFPHTLRNYYVLARSLFMQYSSNTSPTSLDKLSLNEQLVGKIVRPFNSITNGDNQMQDDELIAQQNMFNCSSNKKYEVLNSRFIRGSIVSILDLFDRNKNNSLEMFSNNLKWLDLKFPNKDKVETNSQEVFSVLAGLSVSTDPKDTFGSFVYSDRVYLPVTPKMLTSLLSIKGWCWNCKDKHDAFIRLLNQIDLSKCQEAKFSPADWEYYVKKYQSFRSGEYGMFTLDNGQMGFNVQRIESRRLTKNSKNPFFDELYSQLGKNEQEFENADIRMKNKNEFTWIINGTEYLLDGTQNDMIEEMKGRLDSTSD